MAPRVASLAALALGLMLAPLLAPRRSFVRVSELTPTELRELLQNRSLVHIGGQHRGGTTLLWRGLAAHPSCASQYGGVAAGVSAMSASAVHAVKMCAVAASTWAARESPSNSTPRILLPGPG